MSRWRRRESPAFRRGRAAFQGGVLYLMTFRGVAHLHQLLSSPIIMGPNSMFTTLLTTKNQPLPVLPLLAAYIGIITVSTSDILEGLLGLYRVDVVFATPQSIFWFCIGWIAPSTKAKKPPSRDVPIRHRPKPHRAKSSSSLEETSSKRSSISWSDEQHSDKESTKDSHSQLHGGLRPGLRRHLSLPAFALPSFSHRSARSSLGSDDSLPPDTNSTSPFRRLIPEHALAGSISALQDTPSKIVASSEALLSKFPLQEVRNSIPDVHLPSVKTLKTKCKKASGFIASSTSLKDGHRASDGSGYEDGSPIRRALTLTELRRSSGGKKAPASPHSRVPYRRSKSSAPLANVDQPKVDHPPKVQLPKESEAAPTTTPSRSKSKSGRKKPSSTKAKSMSGIEKGSPRPLYENFHFEEKQALRRRDQRTPIPRSPLSGESYPRCTDFGCF